MPRQQTAFSRGNARLRFAQPNITKPTSLPAPIKGWNTRDALDAMDPLDAIALDNFYQDSGGVNVRGGTSLYGTITGAGLVRTLAEFHAGKIRKFIAASG